MRFVFRRTQILLGLLAALVVMAGSVRAEDEFKLEEGFTSLFNGKDLSGWKLNKDVLDGKLETTDHRFKAQDGAIVIKGGSPNENLYTVPEFGHDFILRLEFRAADRANSGLFIRGKQLQVRDYPTLGPYKDLKKFKKEGWNVIEVTVRGTTALCTCNGEVLEAALVVPTKGNIGLQSETNQLEYRRIRIKEMP